MSSEDQGGAGRREVAYRVLAAEFDDADFSYSESDEERAPNYVVTPTGARVNRLFVVGVLTEVEQAGEDILRARVVDPTGAFVVYAGQYQPEAQAFFDRADPPAFVAVTGKARTFQPDDSDIIYTSVRPENVNEVTAETRDRWNVQAARQTLDRVATMAGALAREERGDELRDALEAEGVDAGLAAGIPLALDHYGTTPAYLDAVRDLAVQVAEVVSGERDEVDSFTADPDMPGDVDAASLAALDVPASVGGGDAVPGVTDESTAASADTSGTETTGSADETDAGGATDSEAAEGVDQAETADGTDASEAADETDATAEPTDPETEPADDTESADDTEPVDEAETSAADASETASPESSGAVDESAADESEASATETDSGSDPLDAVDGAPGEDAADETANETTDVDATGGADATGDDDIGDFEPGEFDLDEEEREEIEAEFGTDFKSGTEVDEPGEAGIETPDPETMPDETAADATAEDADGDATDETSTDEAPTDEAPTDEAEAPNQSASAEPVETEAEAEPADEQQAADVDLETAVMDAMEANDDGDGASESAIVADVTERLGVDESAVEDALQDALMGGQCYEPEDGVYKPI